jgi:hypothetical protein
MKHMTPCREALTGTERARTHNVAAKSRRRHTQLTAASQVFRSVKNRRVMA